MKKNPHAVALGSMRSKKKSATSKENGKKGGRPITLKVRSQSLENKIKINDLERTS